ncbi:MAG TPA: helix-turn-helix domain-containing protein [Vicinamibacterales bacterium]|jgi:AcrR family transcriptional regulator|nr:helix-turn-helix domain-containing protein [Vicinamibacterales bacterium]
MAKRRRTIRPARDERTEARVLEAAHTVFVRRGTAGARMQEIAHEAGVNQALLHYYFRSKERLAEAVFRRAAGELLPRVIDVLGADVAIEDKVARVVELELDHLLRAPFLPGYLISELHHHPERVPQLISAITGLSPGDISSKVFVKLRAQIGARVEAGTMRAITPDQFVVNLLALCVFPFAARPMLMALLGVDREGFERFIGRRRTELIPFFLKALRP